MPKERRNEVLIAFIGLLGVLTTAVLSNLDKIFPPENKLVSTYEGYRATGNFETELRYFFEVSGARKTVENMQEQILAHQRSQLLVQYPDESEEINAVFEAAREEAIRLDEIIPVILPVYRKHFTVEELQELNRFYSTEPMQNMLSKMPLVTTELAPHQARLIENYMTRVENRIRDILD